MKKWGTMEDFKAPLDFGIGSKKHKLVECKDCGELKLVNSNCLFFICSSCKKLVKAIEVDKTVFLKKENKTFTVGDLKDRRPRYYKRKTELEEIISKQQSGISPAKQEQIKTRKNLEKFGIKIK